MARKTFLEHLRTRLTSSSKQEAQASPPIPYTTTQAINDCAEALAIIAPSCLLPPPFSTPINPQLQSPLFSILPAEIRNHIFILATTAYPDPQRPYGPEDWHFRPDTPGRLRIDTALLLTCRRAYDEARLVPVANNTHTFWHPGKKGDLTGPRLTYVAKELKPHISAVHLIGKQGELLSDYPAALRFIDEIGAHLRRLKISFRHEGKISRPRAGEARIISSGFLDMYHWDQLCRSEENAAVPGSHYAKLVKFLRSQFLKMPALKDFEVELEAPAARRVELDDVVTRLEKLPIRVAETRELVPVRRDVGWGWGRETDWPLWSRPVLRRRGIWRQEEKGPMTRREFCVQSAIWRVEVAEWMSERDVRG